MLKIGNILRTIVIFLVILLSAAIVKSAPYYGFESIGSEQGLSASHVKAIAQDSNGFIWLGTKNGLDRYDGVSIRTFNCHDNKADRGNNNIGAIYEAPDHDLWVGTDRGVYIFNPRTESFKFFDVQSRNGVSVEDWVQSIDGDGNGNTWILVPNQGVFRYKNGNVKYYSVTAHNGDKEKLPLSLIVTRNNNVYVGTNRQGLFVYDRQTDKFRRINKHSEALDKMMAQYLAELPDGRLCVGSRMGEILLVSPTSSGVNELRFSKSGELILHSMACVDNELWLGTSEGIYSFTSGGSISEISRHTMGHRSLSDDIVTCLFMDHGHNVWAGTMFGGVNYIQRSGLIFEKYGADITQRGLTSNRIRGMTVDSQGKVWVGTEESGLNILDPVSGNITKVPVTSSDNKVTLCLESIEGKVYAGFARGGCVVMQCEKPVEKLGTYLLQSVSDVYSILQDNSGNLWIAASWGLYRRDKGADEFTHIEHVGYGWIYDIYQASNGMIWIASMGEGIWSYDPVTDRYNHYAYDESHSNGLRSNSISSIMEDSKGRLWFSTDRGGLSLFNPDNGTFSTYGIESGFPDNTVYDVIEDDYGFLWFGTNRGLVKFNPETGGVKIFSKWNKQFNYHSVAKTSDGRIYMGGIEGLLVFNPGADEDVTADVPVFFTDFRLTGTDFSNEAMHENLHQSIIYSDHIELAADAGNFSVSIGSPVYVAHGNDSFVYRLLPISQEWAIVTDPSNLSFAGISPGDYSLEVKRIGETDATRRLAITVLAPWYQSVWAKCTYALLSLIFLAFCWAAYRRRQLRKFAEKENIFTIEKEKELYKKKMQFFTEIAHEIRTPLTLIGAPLEAIEETGVADARIERYLKVIRQNTSRLLNLTGQILDFQKIDSEEHALKFETADINAIIQDIVDRFEMTISTRSKELICTLPERPVLAKVDKEAVIKILSNLFNNALKYSDHHIEISLRTTEENFEVSVKSDGEKISGDNRYKIFEPFYQASNRIDKGGVGIGLPLCRTLAHLHGGTIELIDDAVPNINTFRLTLPIRVDLDEPVADASPVMTEYVLDEESPVVSDNSSYSLLFVDDNDEMREFLYDQLSKNFVVETACNGQEAIEKVRDHRFDIIITDIMMPEMDGYELCKAIKADPNLSPIPVVFLTAKNDLESKVRALECGGESYIEKPFSIKYFRQQIISLLDNRRYERKAFLNKPFFTVDNMKMNKADEEFMNKVISLIKDNIDNESFNVEGMSDILCMSRSSMLRKIKALFNLSPVELIRIIRLKKAAELIQEGKYRMGDICYMVGINSQSYFTRLFFKQFGVTPKAFEKQCQEKSHVGTDIENKTI